MKYFIFPLLFSFIVSCGKKESLLCDGPQPTGKICENGTYRCQEGMVEVPGSAEALGCVPKGFYDFICANPCPPYSAMVLRSNGFAIASDVSGDHIMTLQLAADDHPVGNGDWGPIRDEKFFTTQLPGSQEILLEMPSPQYYRLWDPAKEEFSKNYVNGRVSAAKDTIYLTYWYGWNAEQNYRENRCDLIFLRSDLLQ